MPFGRGDPLPAFALGGNLVTDAFPDDFAHELGKEKKEVASQTAYRMRCAELLRHKDEGYAMFVKLLHTFGRSYKNRLR